MIGLILCDVMVAGNSEQGKSKTGLVTEEKIINNLLPLLVSMRFMFTI